MIRLRQVALVAHDLDAVLVDLNRQLGLEVAFNDPGVAVFGLRNAVLPVGTQFIEVVSPIEDGTAAGRQLQRLGGDGGYMVISHTDDQGPFRERASALGIRTAFEADDHGYKIWQLHPGDTGGSFLEIDFQPGGEDPNGPWMPAGPDWQRAVRTDVVDGITAVELAVADPEMTAAHWSEILGQPHFDNAEIRWSEGTGGLVAVELACAADTAGTTTTHRIGGVDFTY
jgi:hypothetical protein